MAARKRGLLRRMSSAVLGSARLVEEDPDPVDAASAAVLRKSSAQREQNATLERDIKEMFQCFDNDGSKQLDSDEFCDALSMLSIHLDARDMRALFDEIDTSGGGDLEMEEWETMMTRSKKLLMGRNGPRITKTEVANVVQSILVDTAHRKAVQVQSIWRGANTRRRERRPTSVADRQRAFEQRLSQARMEREESKSASWLTHPVCWRLIQPGFKRLGIGYQDSGPAHAVDQERAYDMYQMVRPPGVREGMHQESKAVDEFAEQLYGLLLVPGTGGDPPLFEAEDSAEVALWRTLVRRYLWLKLMHNTINDSKMMHGARGQGQLVEEEKRIKSMIQQRRCFFEADDGFRLKWDLVQVVVLLLTAVIVPLRVGFSALDDSDPKFWFVFDVVSDTYFAVDIVINCRTAYVNDEHKIEASAKKVVVHYLKTWFLIDFLACLPINYILYLSGTLDLPWLANQGPPGRAESGGADSIKVLKVLRLFRLTKMLRVLKLKSISDRLQDSSVYQTFLTSFKLMKLIILLLYLSHFLACFWYLIGTTDENPTPARIRYGWVSRNYNDGTWNDYNGYSPTPLVTRYITALFHSLTDFGMDFAETDYEMTWISIQHIIYEAFMAYLTGVLAGEVIVGNAAKQKYSEKMGEIREFMQHHNIHRSTRQKVTAFYEHLNDKKTFFDEQEVLNEFPPTIRKQIVEEIYGAEGGRVMQIPFIANLPERLRFELCVLLQPLPARFGDEILTQGDYGDEMYILVSGMCAVFKRDNSEGEPDRLARRKQSVSGLNMNEQLRIGLEALGKTEKELGIEFRGKGERVQDLYGGSFFGEEALLQEEAVRETTIIALAESQLLYLSRRSLDTLRDKDKAQFISALSRFDELRQRQKKAWVKQTQRFDEHLAKLDSPEKVSQLRDIFDRDPTFHEMMKFESVISSEQKKLKAEALEAIYARLCVRELPQGMDATDESRKGINLVLRGELQGVVDPRKETSVALRRSKSAPAAGIAMDKGSTVTLAVGSCFSSLELIEEIATPHYLVESAVVQSKTATVLWLDEQTWRWTRMRDSQLDAVAAFDGASDEEDEEDYAKQKESVAGRQTERSSRQRAVVLSDQPPDQPIQKSGADHPTAGDSPRSILAKAANSAASIDELAVKIDAQADEIHSLGGRLLRIEGGLEEITALVRALGARGNGLGEGTQSSTLQPAHSGAARWATPPRHKSVPQPEPEPEPAGSSDVSSTDGSDDCDDDATTPPMPPGRHTHSSAARSTTPPRRKLVPQPEPELAPVGAAAVAQAAPEASSTDDDDDGDEGAPPIPAGRVSARRRDGIGIGEGAPLIPAGRVSVRRRLPVSGRK